MTKVKKESDTVNNEEDKIYKQGRVRKVNKNNYSLIYKYLLKQTQKNGRLEYDNDELKNEVINFDYSFKDKNYELTDKMMFDLHSIVMKLDDCLFSSMTSWIKQQRYRKKNLTLQVTLSLDGKVSLKRLMKKLNAKGYNETLIELDRIISDQNN